jgi:hypothetical protein
LSRSQFILSWKIQECCEAFDRSASLRNRHDGTGPAETRRPAIPQALSGRLAIVCRRGRDRSGRRVPRPGCEPRAPGRQIGRAPRVGRPPAWLSPRSCCAAILLMVSTSQPMSKLPAANGPGFTMAVDREIGEGGAVRVVKQRCGRAGKGKSKGHRYSPLLSTPSEASGRSVRAPSDDRFGLSWPLLPRVSLQSLRAILSGSMPAAFHQARSSPAR